MRQRTITAVLTVFALMLAVTPAAAETQPGGEATTEMLGIELQIDGVDIAELITVDDVDLSALDVTTVATTVEDPFARVDALPLRVGDQEFGRTTVSSSGGGEETASTPLLDDVLPGTIDVLDLRATTTQDSAEAVFGVAEDVAAQVALLGEAAVDVSGLVGSSVVDPEGAASTVGLRVDGVNLDLGDLLGEDLLGALPLNTLLALADHLLAEVDELATGALSEARAEVVAVIADLEDLAGQLEDDLDTLAAILAEIQEIEADLASLDATTLEDLLAKYSDECDISLTDPDALTKLASCLEGLIAELEGELQDAADDLEETLTQIDGALDDLEQAIRDLLAALEALVEDAEQILADLLDRLAGADLLDLGEIAVGMQASADADDAAAALNCVVAGVDVDCLRGAAELAGPVNDAIATLTGVIGILGLADGDVVLEVFGQASTSTTTGETNEAEAHLEILRLEIPSITIDVDDTLDGLLGDLEGAVDAVLAQLLGLLDDEETQALLAAVDEILGTDLAATAAALVAEIEALELTVAELFSDIDAALDLLIDLITGNLPDVAITTPSLSLVLDPTVTAAFTPGAPAPDDPDDDIDLGAPDPDDEPPLPTTGGGLALLALLALAGAAALLRRRPDGAI